MAAEIVTESLGGREGGEFASWLRETVGSLELRDRAVLDALIGLGVPVATTNYDDLIERASGYERATWRDGAAVQYALQHPQEHVVVHLHGHWRAPAAVILGVRSYDELGGDGPAQSLQRAMATMSSLLFVGVGDGASDPNFAALRAWLVRTFSGSEHRHYRLCLAAEVEALGREHRDGERIMVVGYGEDHGALAGFLRGLVGAPSGAQGAANAVRGAAGVGERMGLPAPPVTVGRAGQVSALASRLAAQPPPPSLLLGGPGIGKTNLTLAALHDADVVARFGERRWFVRCDGATSAVGMVAQLASVLGVTGSCDPLPGVLARLGAAPAALALDNFETPWEADTLAVEELVARLAAVGGLALVVSSRGAERPAGVRWGAPIQLAPLELAVARDLFLSIAPQQFDAPGLNDLLQEMGGVPLAIELLAHAAHGEDSLDGLAGRWRAERVRVLQRASGDHRLLSIAVSIDTSWTSLLMTDSARRLLSLLGRLPDGVASEHVMALLPGEGPEAANVLRRRGLVVDELARLRTLPPVRYHLAQSHPPLDADWLRALGHYAQLAETLSERAGRDGGADALARLALEAANITVTLTALLESGRASDAYVSALCAIGAARYPGADVTPIAELLLGAAERDEDARVLALCSLSVGELALARSDNEAARAAYERAQPLYAQIDDVQGEANCIKGLGDITLAQSDHEVARAAYERAQPLYAQIGDVLGEANCIQRLGDIALAQSDHEVARAAYEQALELYLRTEEPYSIGQTYRRLARITEPQPERCVLAQRARQAWASIARDDLVTQLKLEFHDCEWPA